MPESAELPTTQSVDQVADRTPSDPISKLARELTRLQHHDRGTLARLRRTDPLRDGRDSIFETERVLRAAGIAVTGNRRERWALVLHCLAIAQGRHSARADAKPGQVFAQLRFSEARVKQIVQADWRVLCDLMPRIARRLAAAGETVNWWPLATLLLYADDPEAECVAAADAARREIVAGYLSAGNDGEASND